ncbi:MAG: uroporphyrinogen decarboxylase family protein [Candidatus Ratteibacteria bacterium]|nr:uroporphyrinogen decarboxylase family protein [Candidatus Ratteibacteria bacterium]
MKSRERIDAALNHRQPDRTPIFEYVLQPPVADVILGRQYIYGDRFAPYVEENGWEKAVRQMARDMVELAVKLQHDMLYVPMNPPPPSPKQPSQIREEVPFSDPVEDIRKRVETTEDSPYCISEEPFFIYPCLKESMNEFDIDLPILAPAYAHGVWTDTALMQTMVLEPELVHRLYAARTRDTIVLIDKYHSLGIEMFGVGGDFAGTRGPMISPAAYRRFIMPEIRILSRHIHSLGRFAVNASDGNLWPVIEDFLIGCEVDGYIEIDFFAGMDIGKLKGLFGDTITLFGNLDCGNILSFGTIEDVKEHTMQILKKGWGNGGHILCASNAITASIPIENYLAVYQAYREFFNLN